MAMFDFDKPLYTRLIPKEIGIDITKMYYVAFFNGNKLDTRPIKIIDIFKVGEKLVRQEVNWEYYFEVEKSITEKLLDKRLWKRLLGIGNEIIHKTITESYKIKSQDDLDMINMDYIGASADIAKLKVCMLANVMPHPSADKIKIINDTIDIYRAIAPDLLIKAMDWSFSEQVGDITNYGNHFLTLADDTRNT